MSRRLTSFRPVRFCTHQGYWCMHVTNFRKETFDLLGGAHTNHGRSKQTLAVRWCCEWTHTMWVLIKMYRTHDSAFLDPGTCWRLIFNLFARITGNREQCVFINRAISVFVRAHSVREFRVFPPVTQDQWEVWINCTCIRLCR